MSIFDIFKKPAKSKEPAPIPSCFDKADYYFEDAMRNYCRMKNISEGELAEEDYTKIQRIAAAHIGLFMTWIIKHGFTGDIHEDDEEAVEAVKNDRMTGTDFLLEYCDGKLYPEDMSDSILPFAAEYYESRYMSDYTHWVVDELCDLPFEFTATCEDYCEFEHILDKAYEDFLKSHK